MATRPVNRRAQTREAPARPAVRDFTGGVAGRVIEWDVRPVFDFLFSLTHEAGATEDLPADDRRWLADARASVPEPLRPIFDRISATDLAIDLACFVVERRGLRSVQDLLVALEAEGPAPLIRGVFAQAIGSTPAVAPLLERALAGDATGLAELQKLGPDCGRGDRMFLLDDPAEIHAEIMGLLRHWAGRFAPIEGRIKSILERDFNLRANDRTNLAGPDLIEKTTGGVRWLPEPGVRRVVMAPSYFSRPFNFLLAGEDWRFFGYPVADDALETADPLAPPQQILRLHRALGDETRLRILKLLTEKDLYMTEIAQRLDLSKPTIKHHLGLLRAAGLLTAVESGAVVYYSLRRVRLDDAAIDLKRFLIG